jgi:predicted secreted protein
MKNWIAIIFLVLLGSAHAQSASQEPKGSRISLDARVTEEVDNDVMRAALFVEMQDVDAAKLAEKVNQATNDAVKTAKGFTGLRVRTSGYATYPVTDKSKIVRWRSRSEISVEGEDFRRMTEAIGKLQAVMQLGTVSFSVSLAKRAKAEDGLTQSAIAEFLRKAESATKGFQGGEIQRARSHDFRRRWEHIATSTDGHDGVDVIRCTCAGIPGRQQPDNGHREWRDPDPALTTFDKNFDKMDRNPQGLRTSRRACSDSTPEAVAALAVAARLNLREARPSQMCQPMRTGIPRPTSQCIVETGTRTASSPR